jgi:OOP family OmpA-OmpF porin
MPIPAVTGLSLTAEYRFMAVIGDRAAPGLVRLKDDQNHSVLIGLRYEFGAPQPPAAPLPVADLGAKTFLVFFDWNKADLTSRSQAIVRDAATYSTHTQYTRIDVDGNADTSGTPQYNVGLSERRARVVAGELVRDGVPQSAISMHAFGDTKPLVPTGPGVREPQNRRVEIVFH